MFGKTSAAGVSLFFLTFILNSWISPILNNVKFYKMSENKVIFVFI
jgi:hypothetical protein